MIIAGLQGSIKHLTSHANHAERLQTKSNEESPVCQVLPLYHACVARAPGGQESGESFQMGWRRGWTGVTVYLFCAHSARSKQCIP